MRLGTCEREFLIEVEWKLIFSLPQYRYLIPVTERQPEGNADALYAFKSRGFGGEIGVNIDP